MNLAIIREVVADISVFESDEFIQMRDNASAIFA
jgi:hypothetical protein